MPARYPAELAGLDERSCDRCDSPSTFRVTEISRSGSLTEMSLCEPCAYVILSKPHGRAAPTLQSKHDKEIQVELEQIVTTKIHDRQVLLLRERDGERRCYMLVGAIEASIINQLAKGTVIPRPLTPHAWVATIEALGATVQMVSITAWSKTMEKTYVAELRLNRRGESVSVDVRPSDAIAVALLSKAPIMMAADLLADGDDSFRNRS